MPSLTCASLILKICCYSFNFQQNDAPPGGPTTPIDWPGGFNGPNNCYMDGQGPPGGLKPPTGPPGNGRSKAGGGSIPSPATPLTPGSSCGAPHR